MEVRSHSKFFMGYRREKPMMGEAKLNRTALVAVPHSDVFNAYKNFCKYNEQRWGYQNHAFTDFLGCDINWHIAVVPFHPRIAKKIRMLASPHYYTLMRAYEANRGLR